MFDTLVVSTRQRRRGRTAKFFLGTSIAYLSVVAFAFALSILFATPKLADTSSTGPSPFCLFLGGAREKPRENRQTTVAPTKDPRSVEPLERIIANLGNSQPPVIQNALPPGPTTIDDGIVGPGGGGPGLVPGIPVSNARDGKSDIVISDPPRPDSPKAKTRSVDNGKPLQVSSVVLQGKATERVVPAYPELPKRIRMPGEVSVEVIISPEGRVESTRVVSGNPMFVMAALQAARGWRFEPTLLNGVAVRVTGVITFVFKLNE